MTPVGGHDFLDNGFQPSTTPIVVASGNISKNSLWAIMIVFLLILQVFYVNIQSNDGQSTGVLEELNTEYNSQSLTDFDLEFGIDLSGEYIDFMTL